MGVKSSKRQFLVKVEGIEGYWATKTGGNITADVSRVFDGGSAVPDLISAPPSPENVSITRTYENSRDNDQLTVLRRGVGSLRRTISVQPTDQDLIASGKPTVYSNALLVGFTEVEVDASSGDAAEIGLEWAVAQVN